MNLTPEELKKIIYINAAMAAFSRKDLENAGFDCSKVDDEKRLKVCIRIGLMSRKLFLPLLTHYAEDLGIPRKAGKGKKKNN